MKNVLRVLLGVVVGASLTLVACSQQKNEVGRPTVNKGKQSLKAIVAEQRKCSTIADFDFDGDVDGVDYGVFTLCFNGTDNPPGPSCPQLSSLIEAIDAGMMSQTVVDQVAQMVTQVPIIYTNAATPNKYVEFISARTPLGRFKWSGTTDAKGTAVMTCVIYVDERG